MAVLKIKKEDAVLVVIDMQEKLLPAMKNPEEVEETVCKLIKGCRHLYVPVLVTEQYPKGLGGTTVDVLEALIAPFEEGGIGPGLSPIAKTSFSAVREPIFKQRLEELGRNTVILTGIEAHVCVQATAFDLLEAGYNVFVVNDCISSRNNNDKKYAARRMNEAGAIGTTYESVLFELVEDAKAPGFKQISSIVK